MWLTVEEYANYIEVTPQTIYRWVTKDTMPHPYTRFGPRAIRVEVPDNYKETTVTKTPSHINKTKTVAYCRVSTREQKEGLKEQKLAILEWSNKNGITIDETIEEIGSGFNGNRKKLQKLLARDDVKSIVIEHQDRLIRTNFQLLNSLLEHNDTTVICVNERNEDTDLMQEVMDFFVSACGRFYGQRVAKRVKEKVVEATDESAI